MNVIFIEDSLEELFLTATTKSSKYKKLVRDKKFVEAFIEVVRTLQTVDTTAELKLYSRLHYEKLKYREESSVRIVNGRVERLLFTEHENGVVVKLIEIDEDHYGSKR